VRISFEGLSAGSWKLARQALLVEPFESLKVLDVTVIRIFAKLTEICIELTLLQA
jgi:hypothetical protein